MRVGVVILPDRDWPEQREVWRAAEELGFHAAWTYDHLSWRSLRDGPWLGSVPLLSAVAATTERIRLGTLVTSPNFRHPALLAKDAMTLDRISGGRFDLGIGAGGVGFDADVLGLPRLSPSQRADRFAEFTAALDVLLQNGAADHSGDYFTAVASRTYPGCVQRPRLPFTVAAAGPRAMAVAVQFAQTWVTYGPVAGAETREEWFAGVADQTASIDRLCESADRDPGSLRRLALIGLEADYLQSSTSVWEAAVSDLATLGFTDVAVHWPRTEDPDLPGPPPEVFESIAAALAVT